MNKCYIRRKGTNRWLRFRYLEILEKSGMYSSDNKYDIISAVEGYHEENSLNESHIYEVTKDKKKIITVEVKMHLEPYFSGEIK